MTSIPSRFSLHLEEKKIFKYMLVLEATKFYSFINRSCTPDNLS